MSSADKAWSLPSVTRRDIQLTCLDDESRLYPRRLYPVRADGMRVWMLGEESPYLDLVMGYSSINFGHANPVAIQAIQDVSSIISQIHSFHVPWLVDLSEFLVSRLSPNGGYRCYYDVGGSAAVGTAIRIARSATGRRNVISFSGAFHGCGFASAAATDQVFLGREQYGTDGLPSGFEQTAFPDDRLGVSSEQSLAALRRLAKSSDPACVIIEPIQGAAGFRMPPAGFLAEVQTICRDCGSLFILDDIQMGVGRSGDLFSARVFDLEPDITLLSKSLAGGLYPLSVTMARDCILQSPNKRTSAFQATFDNSPIGTFIALRILTWAEQAGVYAHGIQQGKALTDLLQTILDFPFVACLRCIGLAIAFDCIDPTTGQASSRIAEAIVQVGFDQKLLLYASGPYRNVIKLAPPLTITDSDVALVARRLEEVMRAIEGNPCWQTRA